MNTLLVDSVPRTRILINTGKLTAPTKKLRIFSNSCPLSTYFQIMRENNVHGILDSHLMFMSIVKILQPTAKKLNCLTNKLSSFVQLKQFSMREFSPQEEAQFCSFLRSELKKSNETKLTPKMWANVAQKMKRTASELQEQYQMNTQYKGKIAHGLPFIGVNTPSPSPASSQKKNEKKNSDQQEEVKKTPKRKIEFSSMEEENSPKKPKKSPKTILKSFELTPKKKETPKQSKKLLESSKPQRESSEEESSEEEPVKKIQKEKVEKPVKTTPKQTNIQKETESVKKVQTPSKKKLQEDVSVQVDEEEEEEEEEEEVFPPVRISKFQNFIKKISNETNKDQMEILHALYINSGDILNTILFLKNEDYDESKIWKVQEDKKLKNNQARDLNKTNTEIGNRRIFLNKFK
jgi:hypothetical protein